MVVLPAVVVAGLLLARFLHRRSWSEGAWSARAHLTIAWALVTLGLVHVVATSVVFPSLSSAALWFASGGIAMSLGGSLNVLQRLYARFAPGISPACVAGNLALTALAAAFVARAGPRVRREPQFLLLLGLLLAGTMLSIRAGIREHRQLSGGAVRAADERAEARR